MMSKVEVLVAKAAPVTPTVADGPQTSRTTPPAVSRSKEVLSREMCEDDFASLFVTASEKGPHHFYCMVCCKDVSLKSKGRREFKRHFQEEKHFLADQRARCAMGLKVYDYFAHEVTLTAEKRAEIMSRPPVILGDERSFAEDAIASGVDIDANVPTLTLVNCTLSWLRTGGPWLLVRRLWGDFRTTLKDQTTFASRAWSMAETMVGNLLGNVCLMTMNWFPCFVCFL